MAETTYTLPTFKTIRQTAAMGLITEHYLRGLVAQGKCPGVRSGNRFLVNVEALAEQLDTESRRNCEGAADRWEDKKTAAGAGGTNDGKAEKVLEGSDSASNDTEN